MPTLPGSRGSSGRTCPERLSWIRIVRTQREGSRPPDHGPSAPRVAAGARGTVAGVTRREPAPVAAAVDRAFRSLPERYLGAPEGFDTTCHVVLGDLGRSWEVRCTSRGARVRAGGTRRRPDVTIWTDADTWLALREGTLSGIEAFSRRRLWARGRLDDAKAFEGLFRLP